MSTPFEKYQHAGLQYTPPMPPPTFLEELSSVLNKHSKENVSGTPDFILANYLHRCLETFEITMISRAEWRGESLELPALTNVHKVDVFGSPEGTEVVGRAELELNAGVVGKNGPVTSVIAVFGDIPASGFTKNGKHHAEDDKTVEKP